MTARDQTKVFCWKVLLSNFDVDYFPNKCILSQTTFSVAQNHFKMNDKRLFLLNLRWKFVPVQCLMSVCQYKVQCDANVMLCCFNANCIFQGSWFSIAFRFFFSLSLFIYVCMTAGICFDSICWKWKHNQLIIMQIKVFPTADNGNNFVLRLFWASQVNMHDPE